MIEQHEDLRSLLPQLRNKLINTTPQELCQDIGTLNGIFLTLHHLISQSLEGERLFSNSDLISLNDTLAVCLQRAQQVAVQRTSLEINDTQLSDICRYLRHHFGHAQGPLCNSLLILLNKLVQYALSSKDCQTLLSVWASQVLELGPHMTKLHYNMAEYLADRVEDKSSILRTFPDLVAQCVTMSSDRGMANAASKLLVAILGHLRDCPHESYAIWSGPVLLALASETNEGVLIHTIPALSRQSSRVLTLLLEQFASNDLRTLISLQKIGMNIGQWDPWTVYTESDWEKALTHTNPKVRLDGLCFLFGDANSKAQSKPIDRKVFERFREYHVVTSFAIEQVESRQLFLLILKRFITGKYAVSTRKLKSSGTHCDTEQPLQHLFLYDLLQDVSLFLESDASYSQVMLALQIVGIVVDEAPQSGEAASFLSNKLFNDIVRSIFNPFDDARQLCARIALKIERKYPSLKDQWDISFMLAAFRDLENLGGWRSDAAVTLVAFHADAYLSDADTAYRLIDHLTQEIEASLLDSSKCVHGHCTALASIVSGIFLRFPNPPRLKAIILELFNLSNKIWLQQRNTLLESSDEELVEDDARSTYAWKVTKASSVMMMQLAQMSIKVSLIDGDAFVQCGELIIEQISLVKHRGVFLSIYPYLTQFIATCLQTLGLEYFPPKLLRDCLALAQERGKTISRRSAGLPFLISGILLGYKRGPSHEEYTTAFALAMSKLQEIARLPYTHSSNESHDIAPVNAFNCIRQIFTESALASHALGYAEDVLELTLANFAADNWLIRNCATMLFGSLMKRVFGDFQQAKYPFSLFFDRYPRCVAILSPYLSSCDTAVDTRVMFPILLLLLELDTPNGGESDILRAIRKCLKALLTNRQWKVREMTAKCMAQLLSANELETYTNAILESAGTGAAEMNQVHTALLVVEQAMIYRSDFYCVAVAQNFGKMLRGPYALAHAFLKALLNGGYPICEAQASICGTQLITLCEDALTELDGCKQLYATTLVEILLKVYLANEDWDNLLATLELVLESNQYPDAGIRALQFCLENSSLLTDVAFRLQEILWGSISGDSMHTSAVFKEALALLYLVILQDPWIIQSNAMAYATVLQNKMAMQTSNNVIKAMTLRCFAICALVTEKASHATLLWRECHKLVSPENSPEMRQAAIEALGIFVVHCRANSLKVKALLSLLEYGLTDEEDEIRFEAANLILIFFQLGYCANVDYLCRIYFARLLSAFEAVEIAQNALELFCRHVFEPVQLTTEEIEGISRADTAAGEEHNNNERERFYDADKDNTFKNDLAFAVILGRGLRFCVDQCPTPEREAVYDAVNASCRSYVASNSPCARSYCGMEAFGWKDLSLLRSG